MSVQPRARAISASSAPSASQKAARVSGGSTFHATARVAGRIAGAGPAPVEDSARASRRGRGGVAEVEVAVAPGRWAVPRRKLELLRPMRRAVRRRRACPSSFAALPAHPAVVRRASVPRAQSRRCVRCASRPPSRRISSREFAGRLGRDVLDGRRSPVEPRIGPPREREALRARRRTERARRDRQRHCTARDLGPPFELAARARRTLLRHWPRQADEPVSAEPIVRVVGAERIDRRRPAESAHSGNCAAMRRCTRDGSDSTSSACIRMLSRRRRPRSAAGRAAPRSATGSSASSRSTSVGGARRGGEAAASRPPRSSCSWTSSCLNGFGKRPWPRYQP